jgi:hypothetical protein
VAGLVEYNDVPEVEIDPPPPPVEKEDVGTATDLPELLPTQAYPNCNGAENEPEIETLPVKVCVLDPDDPN